MDCVYGIFIYEDAAVSDFTVPFDIFNISNFVTKKGKVVVIAQDKGIVSCSGGMKVQADYSLETAPALDVLLVSGSQDVEGRMKGNETLFSWIKERAKTVKFITSVCTGALILQSAGMLTGKKATTHWMFLEKLAEDTSISIMPDMRYVHDGGVVTSQGVTAGIDMALWLVGQIHSPEHARLVKKMIHYNPAPPYMADA